MKLTPGQILVLLAGVVAILQKEGLMDAAGNFLPNPHGDAIGRAGLDVEALLKAHGLTVSAKLDSLLTLLPMLLGTLIT